MNGCSGGMSGAPTQIHRAGTVLNRMTRVRPALRVPLLSRMRAGTPGRTLVAWPRLSQW